MTLLWLCLLSQYASFGQADVYSFFKLVITNSQQQILLVNWDGSWEVPGSRYNQPISIRQFIDSIAAHHGIKVGESKLRGAFTFHYASRPSPTLIQYYSSLYISGELKVPSDCSDIRWFSLADAKKAIPYSEMRLILQQISSTKGVTWGGSFKLVGSGKDRASSVLETFYPLN